MTQFHDDFLLVFGVFMSDIIGRLLACIVCGSADG